MWLLRPAAHAGRRALWRNIHCSTSRSAANENAAVREGNSKVDPLQAFTPFGNVRESKDPFFYTNRRSGRGYSHYSSSLYLRRPYIWPPLRKLFNWNLYVALGILAYLVVDFDKLYESAKEATQHFRPQAQQLAEVKAEGEDEENKKKKKVKIGFRERRIIEYEDRLRTYSSPDKIFRYFATLKINIEHESGAKTIEVLMTPEDFVRSFTPGVMQPRKYGLDKFKTFDASKYHNKQFAESDSIFFQLGERGLITYSDYLFLMTLLSTSPKDFEIAFQIFDVNGDGALDVHEFRRVQELVMSQTNVGQKHRDFSTARASFVESTNSVLEKYYFGPDKKQLLSSEKFLEFQSRLHRDVLEMEMRRRARDEGKEEGERILSASAFADMLLQYTEVNAKKRQLMKKRLRRRTAKMGDDGVTFDEMHAFFNVLFHIDELETALQYHKLAGKALTPRELKRIIHKISDIDLPEDVIFIAVSMFDENGDGRVSSDEFVAIMKKRLQRGLERPRDTGFTRLIDATYNCALNSAHFGHS